MNKIKTKVVTAKIPATTNSDAEESPSVAASESSAMHAGQIRGEHCSIDYGSPPRLTLVHSTSGLANEIAAGQWALSNGLGNPVGLGPKIEITPLGATFSWLADFGQSEITGNGPVRFATATEVANYGGTITGEPGKVTFSRSMQLRVLIPDSKEADSTYLRVEILGRSFLGAVYELVRSAFRSVACGLSLHWLNTKELPHERRWQLVITTRRNKTLGSNFFVPVLTPGERVSAEEIAELAQLIDRRLLG